METIILEKLKARIESTLKHQAEFRSGRLCVDHNNTCRIILEQSSEYQSPLYLMFVDFEKAFDRVNRECVWVSLIARAIPEKIVTVIKESYNNARCFMLHNGQLSDSSMRVKE
ncbi:uncharacterized protein LOC129944879 [Eupeodes corollae]|uniref:uncharacterized protein LOC129944879 n=1 Tax=Eupeodes corollae TaxID=290404 RepID=UPI0024918CB5|nr:uncharacterized protein LOC129944879 [Eupeodes corollae]